MKLQLDKKTGKYVRFTDPLALIGPAVAQASSEYAPDGWLHYMEISKIETSNVQLDPKTGLKSVHATGTGMLKKHRVSDDAYFGGSSQQWEIQFKEDYDDIGVPDIKIIDFKMK
jgi:hypothetical protein